MEAYTSFAKVYDTFMDETPYAEWGKRICEMIEKYGVSKPAGDKNPVSEADVLASERNLVLDLGCGTGTLTELLAEAGFDMIGVDNAEEMLAIAMEKREESGSGIL